MSKHILPPGTKAGQSPTAEQWNAAERIEVLVDILKGFEDHPESLSQADVDNLRQWAARCYVGSRRLGRYATVEGKARALAAARVRTLQHEDDDTGRPRRDHFEAGLTRYFALLEMGGVSADGDWFQVRYQVADGSTFAIDWICPQHWDEYAGARLIAAPSPDAFEVTWHIGPSRIRVSRCSAHECSVCNEQKTENAIRAAEIDALGGDR